MEITLGANSVALACCLHVALTFGFFVQHLGLDAFYCTCPAQFFGHECQLKRECTFGLVIEHSNRNSTQPCAGFVGDSCNFTCDAGYTAVGEHKCDMQGGFSGGRCIRTCFSSAHFEHQAGYLYGLMSGESKESAQNGCDFGSFMPLPSGWELAPATQDFLDIANKKNWNTHVVEASNGWSAYTANHGTRGWFCNMSASDISTCNVFETAGLQSQWDLEDRDLSWSNPPPFANAWNYSGTPIAYDLSLNPAIDIEGKVTKLLPRGSQVSIPTRIHLGNSPLSCAGAINSLAACPTLVNAVGCTATIEVGVVATLCFATCCNM